jgi:nitroreductase
MEFSELIESRRSIRDYEEGAEISDAELRSLFEAVVLSPSSFNLQHWAFVVIRDPEQRSKLQQAAMGQGHIGTCSVPIVVCGRLDAYADAERIYEHAPEAMRQQVVGLSNAFYGSNEQARRDEAIRSASLAAMTLMYAAHNRGYDTCPMIGFSPDAVSEVVGLGENHIPVMLMTLGKGKGAAFPRGYRRPVDEVVHVDRLDGPALSG